MMYFVIFFAAFGTSCLTLYSGFGLGTVLMPVFALFFPIQTAVVATALVHGASNILKVAILGKKADWGIVLRFGVPAVIAAFAGAACLRYTVEFEPIASYVIGSLQASITPLKIIMACMMAFFALFELIPSLNSLHFDRKYLALGGILSGFFGGFSGHQGALRSTFLTKMDLTTESFVGSNTVIGFMVDLVRIFVYGMFFLTVPSTSGIMVEYWPLVITGTFAAFIGTLVGKRFLKKVTMKTVKYITGSFLLLIAVLLGSGVL